MEKNKKVVLREFKCYKTPAFFHSLCVFETIQHTVQFMQNLQKLIKSTQETIENIRKPLRLAEDQATKKVPKGFGMWSIGEPLKKNEGLFGQNLKTLETNSEMKTVSSYSDLNWHVMFFFK